MYITAMYTIFNPPFSMTTSKRAHFVVTFDFHVLVYLCCFFSTDTYFQAHVSISIFVPAREKVSFCITHEYDAFNPLGFLLFKAPGNCKHLP